VERIRPALFSLRAARGRNEYRAAGLESRMHAIDDTIAAIATAPGTGGLAVLRVSGPRALEISDAVFRGTAPLAAAASHTLHHGWAMNDERVAIDEVVAAIFRAPRSYTGDDVVELSCHGGPLNATRVLDALRAAGARAAAPGEFTMRAFLSGKLDLAQAEAVADLIHAETQAARELALSQLAGTLSRRLAEIEERVTDAVAEVEARVDFAEDVGGIEVPEHVVAAIAAARAELDALLEGARWARAVREGVRVPLIGRPNAGKSSLFNALLGEDRAIVTPVPGTTRDRVSESLELAGVRVTLSDTAGLREAGDAAESLGIERTREAIVNCGVALWVVDGSVALANEDEAIVQSLAGKRVLVALNKRDLGAAVGAAEIAGRRNGETTLTAEVSATRGDGVSGLKHALGELLGAGGAASGSALAASNPRHVEALGRARTALGQASAAAGEGAPGEIIALELREALAAIGEVTGRGVSEDLLDRIFSRFCVGK
jgi:tRNA modification GTPase